MADGLRQLGFAAYRAVKLGAPLCKTACAIGDGRQLKGGDVVVNTHRAFQNFVNAGEVVVRQRKQLLADHAAITGVKVADATDAVTGLVVLDPAVRNDGVPLGQGIEVADARPDVVRRCVNHAGDVNLDQALLLGLCAWLRRWQSGLRAGDTTYQLLDVAALDADLAQELINQRCLCPET